MKRIALLLILAALFTQCRTEAPCGPVPTQDQLAWHDIEMYAFIHYSLNTYTNQEWGYGNEDPQLFNPSDLDCRQWVQVCKQAGMKGIIFTAKHHCGFCMWPSEYTEYSVKNSPWKDGSGDVVKELADACREGGLKFGLYLSPWDRNHPDYGKPEYITYFRNQLRELLTGYGDIFEIWFDGANGGNGWYGGADETRSIDRTTYYQWPETYSMVRELQPHCLIWNDGGDRGDLRWVGTEAGEVGETNWSLLNRSGEVTWDMLHYGLEDGDSWVPGETNTSIRPGWFYHENESPKSVQQLMEAYYKSVGRNSCLLLNFPVAPNGRISPIDSLRAVEFGQAVRETFKTDLARKARVKTRGNVTTIDFKRPVEINRFVVEEDIRYGQRVKAFSLEACVDGQWIPLVDELSDNGLTTIGHRRIICFPTVEARLLRFTVTDSKCEPIIKRISVYYAKEAFTRREREVIENSDSLMYVTVLPQDSTILRRKSIDFGKAELESPLLQALLDKMRYTVQDPSQDGVGIAAPQVGINRRAVCVQRFDKEGEPFECYVNIRIDSLAGEQVQGREGCLSVPGMRGLVTRPSVAYISYLQPGQKERRSERIEGFTAVIFQHECDHLDGILYIDKADTLYAAE